MDDDLDNDDFFLGFADVPETRPFSPRTPPPLPLLGNARGSVTGTARFVDVDGDLVYISDDDDPIPDAGPLPPLVRSPVIDLFAVDRAIASATTSNEGLTSIQCLQRVLEIFPDISHEYVKGLYSDFDEADDFEVMPGSARFDSIIERLVESGSYPKQEECALSKKRKRENSNSPSVEDEWTRPDRQQTFKTHLTNHVRAILKVEFPEIPIAYINEQQGLHGFLYQTYISLAHAKDTFDPSRPAFSKGRPSTKKLDIAVGKAEGNGTTVMDELKAARRHVQHIRDQRAAAEAKKQAELENARLAKEAGNTKECSVCFDDLPTNRQIYCEGKVPHFTCFECATNYVRSEVGQSRCRVLCTAGCGAGFAPRELNLLSDRPLLAKLAQLEQQKAIRDAGLEDLEECPFCDYKAEMPPIEENFEFHCMNPGCEKISCRRCKLTSHVPLSCAKFKETLAKEDQLHAIHKIEEAMTEALMRSCNKCKTRFIKEIGCNKMTCPTCSNLQCYVCSATLKNYEHFDSGRTGDPMTAGTTSKPKKCPLFDNVEERHAKEVKEAEAAARAKIMKEIPGMDPSDLIVKMSEAVIKAEADKIKKAAILTGGAPHRGLAQPVGGLVHAYPAPHGAANVVEAQLDGAMDGPDQQRMVLRLPHAVNMEMQQRQARSAFATARARAEDQRLRWQQVERRRAGLPRAAIPRLPGHLHPAGNAVDMRVRPQEIPRRHGVPHGVVGGAAFIPPVCHDMPGHDRVLAFPQQIARLPAPAFPPGLFDDDFAMARTLNQRGPPSLRPQEPMFFPEHQGRQNAKIIPAYRTGR